MLNRQIPECLHLNNNKNYVLKVSNTLYVPLSTLIYPFISHHKMSLVIFLRNQKHLHDIGYVPVSLGICILVIKLINKIGK